jgi:integrase
MASIKTNHGKHGDTHYVLFRHLGKQRSQPFSDERAAKLFRDEINATAPHPGGPTDATKALERIGATQAPIGGPTVAEWVEHHIATVRVRDKTKVKYRQILANDIGPAFGDVRLRKLTFADVDEWLTAMADNDASAKTIRNKYVVLSAALHLAVKLGELPTHPCSMEEGFLPPIHPTKKRILRPDEFKALRDAMLNDEMRLFVQFLIASGCRFSEVTALQPADVDTSTGKAYIHQAWEWLPPAARNAERPGPYFLKDHPKTPTSTREIHVTHEMVQALKDAGMLDPAREFVFLNEDGGPIRQYTFKNKWNAAVKRSGITGKKPTIKDVRATFASWEIKAKVDPLVVQKHMGHANVSTTLKWYAEMDEEEAALAADERGKRLFG